MKNDIIIKNALLLINIFLLIIIISFIGCTSFSPDMYDLIPEMIYINNNNSNNTDNETQKNDLGILYEDIINGIENFVNDNIYINNSFNETDCYKYLKDINNENNQKNIKYMIQYSNFQLSADVSHEIECKRHNLKYYLFSYQLKNSSYIPEKNRKIMNFLNYGIKFNAGLCLVNECSKILEDNFFKNNSGYQLKKESKLNDYLNDTIKLQYFFLYKNVDEYTNNNDPVFWAIIVIIGLIFLIRIFFTIYTNIKLASANKKNIQEEEINNRTDSYDSQNNGKGIENIFIASKHFPKNAPELDEESIEEKYMHFLDFISIFKNILALGETQNYIYNNENLEIPFGFQVITLFFFSLVSTFYNYIYYPSTDYFNSTIFSSMKITLLKFAQFSSYFYLSLNGFIYSFKYMCYYKKHIHNKRETKNKYILLYFLTFIPKIIMFIVTSFIFHSYSINILNWISNYIYKNEFKYRINPRKCLKQMYLYIFFFNSYLQKDTKEGFSLCYNYIYSYVNEFYAIIFIIIIFGICFKFHSTKFEIIIIVLIILNLFSNYFFFSIRSEFEVNKTHYDITAFLGEKLSIKYFHIYLNIFFYGVIAGIIHFYNLDIVSNDRVTRLNYNENNSNSFAGYFPFNFMANLSNAISNISQLKRAIIIILCLSFLILLSSVFFIENKIHENDSFFLIDPFLSFIHIYENHIATILFMILIIFLSLLDSDSAVKQLFNSWPFIFISRIGYFFYSICETTILVFFIVTNYQTYLNLSDLLFLNSGQFICGIFISIAFVVMIEIPTRYYSKKLRKYIEKKKRKKFKNEINEKNEVKIRLELSSFDNNNNIIIKN